MSEIAGRRVLVLEDEAIVAMMIEDMLAELGAVPVGPAASVQEALALLAAGPVDVGLLDINVGTQSSAAVATRLQEMGIPWLFVSGYAAHPDQAFPEITLLQKPFLREDLVSALAICLADSAVRAAKASDAG